MIDVAALLEIEMKVQHIKTVLGDAAASATPKAFAVALVTMARAAWGSDG